MTHQRRPSWFQRLTRRVVGVVGASALTAAFFLVLPLIQAITKPPELDLVVQRLDTANLEPPPPMEDEPEPEPEPEEKPPELIEDSAPLDLAQLELALNAGLGAGIGEGWLAGDFGALKAAVSASDNVDALFSLADLDQEPRKLYTPPPVFTPQLKKRAPATVYVLFTVDPSGRVETPIIQKSTDPAFEKAALAAVKQWRFESGKRNGVAVRFRMRVPITFPKK